MTSANFWLKSRFRASGLPNRPLSLSLPVDVRAGSVVQWSTNHQRHLSSAAPSPRSRTTQPSIIPLSIDDADKGNIMSRLALYLLGPPRIDLDGEEVHLGRRKAMALLAYLAVTGQPHSRDALAALFWPDYDQSRASADLRRTLSLLNRTLGEGLFTIDRETAGLLFDTHFWLDVREFRYRLAATAAHDHLPTGVCPDCLPLLEEAAALYQDHFLAGFTLRDSLPFDEWQFFQTEALRDQFAGALVRLARYHTAKADSETAVNYARRWLAVDPTHEQAHQHLMALYAQSGQRAAALRQYEVCRRTLAEELGVEPSTKIREMYERLAAGDSVVGPSAVEAVLERELRTVGACPYRGLAAFREEDAAFFFGREGFVERLFQAVHERSLVAVIVGSSGSGKSSAVYAGLLPRLREGAAWLITDLRPGGRPYDALAAALLSLLEPALSETDRLIETRKLAGALSEGRVLLLDVVERALAKNPGAQRLLLLVDQFEELYTLCPEPEVRRHFLDTLLAVVKLADRARSTQFGLLITLRADFMDQALTHRAFADTLQTAALMMGPMTRDELQAAIEKPAQKQGGGLEAGLVERLLDDVGEEPGNLPLLEFALTLLWERLDYGWMTHAAYEGIGRVEGALARYADEVYAELDEDDQGRARQVFVQLVQPGEGTQDTRRVAGRVELGDVNWALVQYLADKRLVVTGRDVTTGEERVEVVHEALIQRWRRLRHWMEEDREFRTWQERLRAGLRGWDASGRDEGALLRGVPLAEAESWLAERGDELGQAERDYIRAGVDLRQRRQAERERRRRRTVLALAGGLVLAVALAVFALAARQQARTAEQDALRQASVGLAAQALEEFEGALPERGVLLALEALEGYPYTPQAESALAQSINQFTPYAILEGTGPRWLAAEWSPDGTQVAARGNVYDWVYVGIWDVVSGGEPEMLRTLRVPACEQFDLAWSPDGRELVTSSRPYVRGAALCRTIEVWDMESRQVRKLFSGNTNSVDWSPDGSQFLTADDLGYVHFYDADSDTPRLEIRVHSASVSDADWSPNGRWIATASADGTAKVWQVAAITESDLSQLGGGAPGDAPEPVTLIEHTGELTSLAWAPDSARLATASSDGTVRMWLFIGSGGDLSSESLYSLVGHSDAVLDVDWSPDGGHLATAAQDGTVRVWDAATGAELLKLQGVVGSGQSVAWSPDGDRLVVSGTYNEIRVWNVSEQTLQLSDQASKVCDARWSPDGSRIATASFGDGTVGIWDAGSGTLLRRIDAAVRSAWVQLDWSPDGTRVVTTDEDDLIAVWDAQTGERLLSITGIYGGSFFRVAWAPDSPRIVATDYPGTPTVFDADTGATLVVTKEGECGDQTFSWSPDGRYFVGGCMGSEDNPSGVWDAVSGELLFELPSQHGGSVAVAWSPDGDRIAVGYDQGVSKVWDVSQALESGDRAPRELVTLLGDTEVVWTVAWSPNGRRLASASGSGVVRLWEVDTGAEIMRFRAPEAVSSVDWSPDGQFVIASCGFGSVAPVIHHAWQSTEELIAYSKECCVPRELTPEERSQFGLPER